MCSVDKFKRNIELFVFDIYVAILKVEDTSSRFSDAQEMLYDYNAWDSVIREFEIIGEAGKHLVKNSLLDKEYQVVVDFRNQITHEYFGIDPDIVWTIVQNDLFGLKDAVSILIQKMDSKMREEMIDSFIEDNGYLSFVVKALERLR